MSRVAQCRRWGDAGKRRHRERRATEPDGVHVIAISKLGALLVLYQDSPLKTIKLFNMRRAARLQDCVPACPTRRLDWSLKLPQASPTKALEDTVQNLEEVTKCLAIAAV